MARKAKKPHHDALFKHFLTQPETAREFLSLYLPEAIRSVCDLTTLKLEPGSFVDRQLRQLHSDVLYSVETTHGDGYIYCLIEHQSTPDPLMAWRLMYYSLSAMAAHLKKGHTELPLVVPLLFYHGEVRPYPYSNRWLDCFTLSEHAAHLYNQPLPLVDISALSDEEILTHKSIALMELVQKHIRCRDMLEWVPQLVALLNAGYNSAEQRHVVLSYILLNGHTLDLAQFVHQLTEQSPEHETMLMTIAEQLEQKGREQGRTEGRAEGRTEGRAEGREEGKLETARALLRHGVSLDIIVTSTGLSREKIEALKH
ncbi:Rpn family recombination-promoting nuclease/putative transposase [Xenorhabdus nematophila]|uniref:Transposase n=2 Tax=Xenorhabdus nematophila TaxID=628 RepID=D3VHH6_XENNA|nr:Rpn family recombination-promoting nuclease/putative transposase [Xenorhabdus nematophila]CEE90075.1 putative transposase [Xenorhabdus nematophila str. Anatoliense]CEF31887.1 putative transposase [Xenorhabdus nematophila str. Websteri]AYA40044.1 Rpn family recombination-promoting nuclease/putative transposase [Xenorhabdus nematophila]MBA0018688.1 Rpn family recombination-promoting nuclease/putative transposase [Xenorhabdus nematophila]MCB4425241.1 Rpn family recombination-promoting nuclease